MTHHQRDHITARAPRRRPSALGALFVLGGLALALSGTTVHAQDAEVRRAGQLDRTLDEAATEVRTRQATVERLTADLARAGGSGAANTTRLERLLDNERRLLREAQARFDALRGRSTGNVPMDGQPVVVGIDTNGVEVRRSSDRVPPPMTTDRRTDRVRGRDRPFLPRTDRRTRTDPDAPRDAVPVRRRGGVEAELARLERELVELRQRWAATEDGAEMTAAERERVSERLERARDHAEELMTELRIADESSLGPRHPHVVELREELAGAESRIDSLQRRLTGHGSAANRQELAEQIEQRLARMDRLRARLAQAEVRREAPPEGRERLGDRVHQLETAVGELRDLLQRHRVDEHRVVRALQEVDRRRGETPLPPPADVVVESSPQPPLTPALHARIEEAQRRVEALASENNALRQHADALAKSLAEHERMRAEIEQRGWTRHHPERAPHRAHTGAEVQTLRSENLALRREANLLRQQLADLRAAHGHRRHGVYPR